MSELNIFSLSPNPFTDAPWLQNNSRHSEDVSIEIFTLSGELLHSEKITMTSGSLVRINAFADQPSGLYITILKTVSGKQILKGAKL